MFLLVTRVFMRRLRLQSKTIYYEKIYKINFLQCVLYHMDKSHVDSWCLMDFYFYRKHEDERLSHSNATIRGCGRGASNIITKKNIFLFFI